MSSMKASYYSDDDDDCNNNLADNNYKYSTTARSKSSQVFNDQSFIRTVLMTGFAFSAVLYGLFTTSLLITFLSGNVNGILKQKLDWHDLSLYEAMAQDVCLLLMFVTQHKVMAKKDFKRLMLYVIPEHLQRSVYIISTGIVVQFLTSYWINAVDNGTLVLWDLGSSGTFCLLSQLLHLCSWIYTFFIILTMDLPEFIGLKQVYYHANNFGCPMSAKKPEAQRFFAHFRHPTSIGLLVVFWVVPCMTLDRLLLSAALTMYLFSTDFDREDAQYVQDMYKKKLKALHAG